MALRLRHFVGGGGYKLRAAAAGGDLLHSVGRRTFGVCGVQCSSLSTCTGARVGVGVGVRPTVQAVEKGALQQRQSFVRPSHCHTMSDRKQACTATPNSSSSSSNSNVERHAGVAASSTDASAAAGDSSRRAWDQFSSLGSPRFIMGSMQEGSDFPFRLLWYEPHKG